MIVRRAYLWRILAVYTWATRAINTRNSPTDRTGGRYERKPAPRHPATVATWLGAWASPPAFDARSVGVPCSWDRCGTARNQGPRPAGGAVVQLAGATPGYPTRIASSVHRQGSPPAGGRSSLSVEACPITRSGATPRVCSATMRFVVTNRWASQQAPRKKGAGH